jgi:hypothetical protein
MSIHAVGKSCPNVGSSACSKWPFCEAKRLAKELASLGPVTKKQINNWFTNKRKGLGLLRKRRRPRAAQADKPGSAAAEAEEAVDEAAAAEEAVEEAAAEEQAMEEAAAAEPHPSRHDMAPPKPRQKRARHHDTPAGGGTGDDGGGGAGPDATAADGNAITPLHHAAAAAAANAITLEHTLTGTPLAGGHRLMGPASGQSGMGRG